MIASRLAQTIEQRSTLTNPSDALLDVFGGRRTIAGPRVGTGTALAIPGYYAGTKILAETMGSMPCEVRRWEGNTEVSVPARESRLWTLLHDAPNPEQHAGDYWECVTTHIALQGNHYSFMQRDEYGRVVALWPIPPGLVDVQRDPVTRRKLFLVTPDPDAAVAMPFFNDDILHFRGFGPNILKGLSPIGALREMLGRAISEQDYQSALLANGARPSGVLTTDNKLDDRKGLRIARRFKRAVGGAHRAGETVILEQGLKWQQVSLSAADAQFIEQREFTMRDIARILRIPADMLLVETGGDMHYTSDESVGLRFLAWTMTPWKRRIAGPLGACQHLPWSAGRAPGRMFPHFKSDLLLQVDRKTRFEAWAVALDNGWMTPNEVRVEEGRPPKDGLDETKPLIPAARPENRNTAPATSPVDEPSGDVDQLINSVLA